MPVGNKTTWITPKDMDEGIYVQVTTDDLDTHVMHNPTEITLQNDCMPWSEILEWASDNVSSGRMERQFIIIEVVKKPTSVT